MNYSEGLWFIEMTTKIDGKEVSHSVCHGVNDYADGPAGQVCLVTSGKRSDAKLISAAPKLLEALQDMIGAFDNPIVRRKYSDTFTKQAIENARDAIEEALDQDDD